MGKAKKDDVPCRFCGQGVGDGHLFWECTFPPLQHVRELLEFAFLTSLDRRNWPRCLLWDGWLPGLSGVSDSEPWASFFGDLACSYLEWCLGAYPVDLASWSAPEYWDADDIALDRRRVFKARSYWYPILLDLHRFVIAVAGVTVNHDGRDGTAPDPLVWDQGGAKKARTLDIWVNVDLVSSPALLVSWVGPGCRFMEVVLLVLILLPGLAVLAFCVSLQHFSVLRIGLLMLLTWGILVFPFWSF